MTIFYGARDDMDVAAAPRPWLVARRLVEVAIGVVYGAGFALLLWVVIP